MSLCHCGKHQARKGKQLYEKFALKQGRLLRGGRQLGMLTLSHADRPFTFSSQPSNVRALPSTQRHWSTGPDSEVSSNNRGLIHSVADELCLHGRCALSVHIRVLWKQLFTGKLDIQRQTSFSPANLVFTGKLSFSPANC